MAEPLTREEFLTHIDYVRKDLSDVKAHLAVLNGRTGKNERDIAVLNDRSRDEPRNADEDEDDPPRRGRSAKASLLGAGVAGAIYGVIEMLKWLKG